MSPVGPNSEALCIEEESVKLPRRAACTNSWKVQKNVDIPGYHVLEEIGRGGMGVVYKARQSSLNRLVALKMLLPYKQAGEADLARLRAEAKAIAALRHPNIIQIYEIGEHHGRPFLALEYCAGGNLDRKINGTPLSNEEAATLVQTMARAIDAAHRVGVVHRDLKPANVLLTEDEGQIKITDFGLAKRVGSEADTRTGQILGTPSFMAPEQAAGQSKRVTVATDIYALGGILYETLTGRPPFRGATAFDTISQVLEQDPAPPRLLNPRVDIDLETICLKCLEKDPARRYATALDLADDLQRYLARESISARSVNLLDRLGRTLGRSRLGAEFFTWSIVVFYFAEVTLLVQVGLFTLISARFSLFWIGLMQAVQFVLMALPFWRYRSQQLLQRTIDERQLCSIWVGYLVSCAFVAVVSQTLFGVDKVYEFYLYPFWAVLTGLAFFVMGTRYWGRCYVFGFAFFFSAVFMPFILHWSALAFGSLWCICLVSIGRHLRQLAVRSADQLHGHAKLTTAEDLVPIGSDLPTVLKQPERQAKPSP
jgi:eukaryotic-like serine/threonine-protein kinase